MDSLFLQFGRQIESTVKVNKFDDLSSLILTFVQKKLQSPEFQSVILRPLKNQ